MTVTPACPELNAFAVQFDATPSSSIATKSAPETEFHHQASDRYMSLRQRVTSSCSVVSNALRLGMLELRSDNDLSRIVKALRTLNDRQLRILGFERESLADDVRELILINDGRDYERVGDGRPMKTVHAALGHAA